MRFTRLLYFGVITTLLISSCKKDYISDEQSKAFLKIFGDYSDDMGYDIKQTNDKGYILVGTTRDPNLNTTDMIAVKTDKYGNYIWIKHYGDSLNDEGRCVQIVPGKGYLLFGTYSVSPSDRDFMALLVDDNGDTLEHNTFGDDSYMINSYEKGNYAELANDGGFIFVGNSTKGRVNVPDSIDLLYMKVDAGLDSVIWTKNFPINNFYDEITHVKKLNANQYLVIGNSDLYKNDASYKTQIFIMKINDSNGDESIINDYFGGSNIDICNSFSILNDGSIIVVGTTQSNNDNNINLWKFNNNLELLWEKDIEWAENDFGNDIFLTSDNNLVVVGSSETHSNGKLDACLMKIDTAGNAIWFNHFGYLDDQKANAVIQASDGGFVFVGSTIFQENSMIYMLKTKPDGQLRVE